MVSVPAVFRGSDAAAQAAVLADAASDGEAEVVHRGVHGEASWRPGNRRSDLAADAPVFPRLAEQTLREIEPFLGFRQLVLDVLDGVLEGLEPRGDLG